jgi:DNA-binding transcriptional MerR regulator
MKLKRIKIVHSGFKSISEIPPDRQQEFFTLIDNLLTPHFTISDVDIEHRTILHWEEQGLIDKQSGERWRKYSFVDYVWLRLVKDLRSFGISIPVIQNIKKELHQVDTSQIVKAISECDLSEEFESLSRSSKSGNDQALNAIVQQNQNNPLLKRINFVVLEIVYSRAPTYLLLHSDATCGIVILNEMGTADKIQQLLGTFRKKSTLVINITNIVDDFFENDDYDGSTYYMFAPISRQEKEIVDIIRQGGVKKVDITLKDGGAFFVKNLRKKPSMRYKKFLPKKNSRE